MFYSENTNQEVSIALFGDCNLRCDFCIDNLRYATQATVDQIQSVIDLTDNVIASIEKTEISFKVYGGELFQDKFSDSIWYMYHKLFDHLKELCCKYNKKYSFQIASNLIHSNDTRDRVIKLCREYDIQIYGSFDLIGRFTKDWQIATFISNALFYKQVLGVTLSFIASNDNIKEIVKGSSLFDTLYNNFDIYYDYCNANSKVDEVSESTLATFLIYLYDKYPNIRNFKELGYKCNCPSIFIIEDKVIYNCCDFKSKSREAVVNKGCITCEFYNTCPRVCTRLFSSSTECHIKELLSHVKSHQA